MQQIHINRNKINSIEFEDNEITVPLNPGEETSIELAIINYGPPTHVHLSTGETLRGHVKFLHDNPYVVNQEMVPAVIRLPPEVESLDGEIKVTTGYGSHTRSFKMVLGTRPAATKPRLMIEVDERLGVPQYMEAPLKDTEVAPEQTPFAGGISEKFIFPLVLVLFILAILLTTFTFKKLDAMLGALAVSIIVFVLIVYALIHLLTSTEKED